MKYIILLFIFIISIPLLHSQPEMDRFYGCHHSRESQLLQRKEPSLSEQLWIENSNRRSDTFDIINYSIHLDVTNVSEKKIRANTEISFKVKLDNVQSITFDLLKLTVDSIYFNNEKLNFSYDSNLIVVHFNKVLNSSDSGVININYQGTPSRDSVWGGLYFVDKYIYNLGIGLSTIPPNFGKVWFPCFDNFVERSSYDYFIKSASPTRAYCVGHLVREDSVSQTIERHYRMDFPIPTYLSSFAVSDYILDRSITQSVGNLNLPIDLIARPGDISKMKSQLAGIPDAVDAFEYWFGPYKFERVGFVATTVGAMEHPTNTAYPISSVVSGTLTDNERLMAHEFGHQWWGNLTTLDDARDMWIKEGNAEYASHLFFEHVYGKERFQDVVKANLSNILFSAHVNDGEYLPLSPMPYEHTYGTHTYRKGAAMIHNLRSYLGDSIYRAICHTVFDSLTGKSLNAFELRDFINRNSTRQVTDFFNDHIFNKGYLGFYIDSLIPSPEQVNRFHIQIIQKIHHADHLGRNVPIQIVAIDKNFNRKVHEVMVSNESSWHIVDYPLNFYPEYFVLNEEQSLNYASLQDKVVINSKGTLPIAGSGLTPSVVEISDTAYINMQHHLVGPSEGLKKSNILKLSSTHFWQVYAIPQGRLKMAGRVDYNGNGKNSLDFDILKSGEDSVILVYRKDFREEWRSYQPVTKLKVTPNDLRGIIRIDDLIPGEYALAYGYNAMVSTQDSKDLNVKLYPNPIKDQLNIELDNSKDVDIIQIIDEMGHIVLQQDHIIGDKIVVDTQYLPSGSYSLIILSKEHLIRSNNSILIQR
ncbi:MAG: hypothetical protein IT267_12355 [Saprospiraceae bacterium]|nr:hypothetical protein [Saprospiraceae bacterium]